MRLTQPQLINESTKFRLDIRILPTKLSRHQGTSSAPARKIVLEKCGGRSTVGWRRAAEMSRTRATNFDDGGRATKFWRRLILAFTTTDAIALPGAGARAGTQAAAEHFRVGANQFARASESAGTLLGADWPLFL